MRTSRGESSGQEVEVELEWFQLILSMSDCSVADVHRSVVESALLP